MIFSSFLRHLLPPKTHHRFLIRPLCLISFTLLSSCSVNEIDSSNDFENNGRDITALKRETLYLKESLPPGLPMPDASFESGLQQQLKYLNRIGDKDFVLENTQTSVADLKIVAEEINNWLQNPAQQPQLIAHQLAGQDQRGNVQITGYYVPVLPVRHLPDEVYRYPLYRKPVQRNAEGKYPSREEIDFENALAGQGLEIAYTSSLVDNFFLHVQGSGVVEYENGERKLLSWGGVNGHAYRSLGKELIERGEIDRANISAQSIRQWLSDHPERNREILSTNPSYLFFSEGPQSPVGAANVPLTPLYSAAVDPKVIPLGSILLAQVPKLDTYGNLVGHEFRLLLAQDKGGAIKGPGHIDWYQGIGEEAHFHAGQLKHFGKVWLLLPQNPTPKILIAQ
ncbi:membrane-bound lytic murein transglycosylase A [Marinomonas polaris DSM 16579]|uniref:peptidoglycan lytic exotransglycosylase n=1 Tax=Marinomonas polaris DSM 16579 TaxID=1122206 RepID=A0A1M5HAL7_9GAMM|nr:murein transglycosylase A [Marinomonas polaris]SHG12994.1 membrane-bound lytic murein transglycosylase A [Marinomonas polaris DSM 16579]